MKKKSSEKKRSKPDDCNRVDHRRVDRRTFVKFLPAVGLAVYVDAPIVLAQQPSPPQTPQRITKEMLKAAEQLIGVELKDAEETMALPGVNRNLASYEAL